MTEHRRLTAILVADVVGYSKLGASDGSGTLAKLHTQRANIIGPAISKYAGRLFKSVGDGFLVGFASAVQTVEAARAIQQANAEWACRCASPSKREVQRAFQPLRGLQPSRAL